ncbi:hypothetical protein CLU79DRAFT_735527 [Phycomyces nitens]|nr:hypothetical protein CLU79DRAFT_735527 [Phycomyces nitens]
MALSLVRHLDTHSQRALVIHFMEPHSNIKISDLLRFLHQLCPTVRIIHYAIPSGLFQYKLLLGSAVRLLGAYPEHPQVIEWNKQCSVPFTSFTDIELPKDQVVSNKHIPLSAISNSPFTRQALFIEMDNSLGVWSKDDGLVFHSTFLNILQAWENTRPGEQDLVVLIDERSMYGDIPHFWEFTREKQQKTLDGYRDSLNKSLRPFSLCQTIHSYVHDYHGPRETTGESMAWLQSRHGLSISTSIYIATKEQPDLLCPPYFKNLRRIYLNQLDNLTRDEWEQKFLDIHDSPGTLDDLVYIPAESLNLPNPESKSSALKGHCEQGVHFTIRSSRAKKDHPKNDLSKQKVEIKEPTPVVEAPRIARHLPLTFVNLPAKTTTKRKKDKLADENVKPKKRAYTPRNKGLGDVKQELENTDIMKPKARNAPKDTQETQTASEMAQIKPKRKYTLKKKAIKGDDLFLMGFETDQPKEGCTPRENTVPNEKFKWSAGMQKDMHQYEFPGTQPLRPSNLPVSTIRQVSYDSDATDDGNESTGHHTSSNEPPAPPAPLPRPFANPTMATKHINIEKATLEWPADYDSDATDDGTVSVLQIHWKLYRQLHLEPNRYIDTCHEQVSSAL